MNNLILDSMKHILRLYELCRIERQPQVMEIDQAKAGEYFERMYYKTFPRFRQIPLSTEKVSGELQDVQTQRRTSRNFDHNKALRFEELSNIIYGSCGITQRDDDNPFIAKRIIESGGALYPIELYVVAINIERLKQGIYHYNVLDNTIEEMFLCDAEQILSNAVQHEDMSFFRDAGAGIVLTAIPCRQAAKYGLMAIPYMYKEAGAVGHAIALNAQLNRAEKCESGGFNVDYLAKKLDLDVSEEIIISLHAIGKY